MKIKPETVSEMASDMQEYAKHYAFTPTSWRDMYDLLASISHQRAFDDNHPTYASNPARRVLPYTGRDYCFYYADGCNDVHVRTALKHIARVTFNLHLS